MNDMLFSLGDFPQTLRGWQKSKILVTDINSPRSIREIHTIFTNCRSFLLRVCIAHWSFSLKLKFLDSFVTTAVAAENPCICHLLGTANWSFLPCNLSTQIARREIYDPVGLEWFSGSFSLWQGAIQNHLLGFASLSNKKPLRWICRD